MSIAETTDRRETERAGEGDPVAGAAPYLLAGQDSQLERLQLQPDELGQLRQEREEERR